MLEDQRFRIVIAVFESLLLLAHFDGVEVLVVFLDEWLFLGTEFLGHEHLLLLPDGFVDGVGMVGH